MQLKYPVMNKNRGRLQSAWKTNVETLQLTKHVAYNC